MPIITISREAGSFGDELAERLAQKTGYPLIDLDRMLTIFLEPLINEHEIQMLEISTKYFFESMPNQDNLTFKEYLEKAIPEWSNSNHAIFLGCGGNFWLKNHPRAIHIHVMAEEAIRIKRIKQAQQLYQTYLNYQKEGKEFQLTINSLRELIFMEKFIPGNEIVQLDAPELLHRIDKQYRKFLLTLFRTTDRRQESYHLTMNTGLLSLEQCLNLIDTLIEDYKIQRHLNKQIDQEKLQLQNQHIPDFKNESEAEFAKLLNLYHLDWRYEPKFFPVEWDEDGNVTIAFSPDFYLPKFDLYLELTTMNQRYVSAKKKKLKKLQELYPGIKVKIIYKRDFLSMIQRFED